MERDRAKWTAVVDPVIAFLCIAAEYVSRQAGYRRVARPIRTTIKGIAASRVGADAPAMSGSHRQQCSNM
jgi:hypothetical protein